MAQSDSGRIGENTKATQGDFKSFKDIAYLYTSKCGNVYKAVNASTGRPVVLKTFNENAVDGQGAAILRNEYRILSKIKSDHVPKAIEYSLLGEGQYLAVEYVEGISLREYLERRRISAKEFLHIADQIVRALSDVHDAGVIHKDINPGNIIYNNATRKATIIDFGSATEFSRERSQSMEAAVPEGSLWYISPEQTGRMNHVVDLRTDFYSLGVTFFEMLCGHPPFDSDNHSQILYLHLATPPRRSATSTAKFP